MENILKNLQTIEDRIKNACQKSNRKREEVKLLLATKTVDVDRIKLALNSGYTLIGENKIQEVKEKYEGLKRIAHTGHFIGHLQSNKVKEIIRYGVDLVESVDRMSLAEKLNKRLEYEQKTMKIFIQVNTSYEESKFGVAPEDTIELVKKVTEFKNLEIKGLMTIGLFSAEAEKVRKCFKLLKSIQNQIKELNIPNVEMNELSMGMSGDLEIAIEEGATIVRVGTAVFGKRPYPDSYYWNEVKS